MTDNVNHPPHYKTGIKCDHCDKEIECINISRNFNFALGNVIKYVWRAKHKGDYAEQLRKARWYLNDEIDRADGINFCERVDSEDKSNISIDVSGDFVDISTGDIGVEIYQTDAGTLEVRPVHPVPKIDGADFLNEQLENSNEILSKLPTMQEYIEGYGTKLNQIKYYVENIWSQYMAVSNPKQRDASLCVEAIQTLVEQFNGD